MKTVGFSETIKVLHHNSTVVRRVTMVRTERGVRLTICQGDVS